MIKLAIIIGSTRPGRNGAAVAQWVGDLAAKRSDAEFELVDGGNRAVEHLRLAVDTMLDQVIAWAQALRPLRGYALGRG